MYIPSGKISAYDKIVVSCHIDGCLNLHASPCTRSTRMLFRHSEAGFSAAYFRLRVTGNPVTRAPARANKP